MTNSGQNAGSKKYKGKDVIFTQSRFELWSNLAKREYAWIDSGSGLIASPIYTSLQDAHSWQMTMTDITSNFFQQN
jgi:hypothetical protein